MNKETRPRKKLVSEITKEEIEKQADVLKALANPIRMEMLSYISKYDQEVCGCDFDEYFDLKQPTISHHLSVLQEAGVIQKNKEGTRCFYRINSETLKLISRYLLDLL